MRSLATIRATVLFLACFGASPGWSQGIDVAIVAAASVNGVSDCRMTDPQQQLLATGEFATVDLIDAVATTPTLAQLLNYDAVICWTNATPADNIAWGDTLADYVDAGGGVVVALFANTTDDPARAIGGRWQQGYEIILPANGSSVTGAATLGVIVDPLHPVVAGVTAFAGGSQSFRPSGFAVAPQATIVARWSDTRMLVVESSLPNRIDLGFYPPSSNCSPGFHDPLTDGALLMANALVYCASIGNTPHFVRGDCNSDGAVNLGDPVFLLAYLFGGSIAPTLPCDDSCDGNDDGSLALPDAIALLNVLFVAGSPPLPEPLVCGADPTSSDGLDCDGFVACP